MFVDVLKGSLKGNIKAHNPESLEESINKALAYEETTMQ